MLLKMKNLNLSSLFPNLGFKNCTVLLKDSAGGFTCLCVWLVLMSIYVFYVYAHIFIPV